MNQLVYNLMVKKSKRLLELNIATKASGHQATYLRLVFGCEYYDR